MARFLLKSLFCILLVWLLFPGHAFSETSTRSIIPSQEIDTSLLGLNAFVNDSRFGTIHEQFQEIKNVLGIRRVRVLFAWNDDVQAHRNAQPDFSFYDEIARSIPRGVEAIAVLTHLPSWMNDQQNWINGDPRKTFARLWVRKVAERYRRKRRIKGFQIWNEPNSPAFLENDLLNLSSDPENYIKLLKHSRRALHRAAPRKLLIMGATTALNQNYPDTLRYNQALVDLGVERLLDVYSFHYYSTHYENLIRPDNIVDFLTSLSLPLWLTEIGERGVNDQKDYFEETLPLLVQLVPGLERYYVYQFAEDSPAESTYGLRNLTPGAELSDFYIYLRDLG